MKNILIEKEHVLPFAAAVIETGRALCNAVRERPSGERKIFGFGIYGMLFGLMAVGVNDLPPEMLVAMRELGNDAKSLMSDLPEGIQVPDFPPAVDDGAAP